MTNVQHEYHEHVVYYAYTAQQAVAAGLSVEPFPEVTREAGFRLSVILTTAAYADVVEWTRDDIAQDASGRYWEVLMAARIAAKRALGHPGAPFWFEVNRIPNKAPNGADSRVELPIPARLRIRVEAFDWELTPCLVISLPDEEE